MNIINLKQLIEFFDEKVPSSVGHATALCSVLGEDLGVFLIKHYFEKENYRVNAYDAPCTQGTKKGERLDKWISIEKNNERILYQVEIKNWSAHAIGGKTIALDSDEKSLKVHRLERWKNQFKDKIPNKKSTKKVLLKMKPPELNYEIKPMLCFWDAMHYEGDDESFFKIEIKHDNFSELCIFSMSTYIRNLIKNGNEKIELNAEQMKDTLERKKWIEKIISNNMV